MTITYPLSIPTGVPTAAKIKLYAENVVAVSRSPFTFHSQTYVHPGQMWGASVTLPRMRRDHAEPWLAFLLSLKGRQGYFILEDPSSLAPQGAVTGTVRVNGGGQLGSSLIVDGFVPDTTGVFKAGDCFQIGTGAAARLYKILADVDSDALGGATLDIWPDLRESPSDNAQIRYNTPGGLFRLSSNRVSWDINEITTYGISFDCEEYVW